MVADLCWRKTSPGRAEAPTPARDTVNMVTPGASGFCAKSSPGAPKAMLFPALSIYVNAAFCAALPFARDEAGYGPPLFAGRNTMLDRRQSARDKVIYGGLAKVDESGATSECVVRNISKTGAHLEFSNAVTIPKEKMSLTIARKGRSFLAKVVWWRDNFVGIAFSSERPYELPFSDIEQRLRESEKKKRQLQRRINELLGEG
jgi:hypothetical protein